VPTPGPAYGRATPNLRPTPASSILIDAQSILFVAAQRGAANACVTGATELLKGMGQAAEQSR
jgi:hypothetical protein